MHIDLVDLYEDGSIRGRLELKGACLTSNIAICAIAIYVTEILALKVPCKHFPSFYSFSASETGLSRIPLHVNDLTYPTGLLKCI